MIIVNKDVVKKQNDLEKDLFEKLEEIKNNNEATNKKTAKVLQEIHKDINLLSRNISEENNKAISDLLQNTDTKLSLTLKNMQNGEVEKLNKRVSELEDDKKTLKTNLDTIQESHDVMKKKLEITEKQKSTALANSGNNSRYLKEEREKNQKLEQKIQEQELEKIELSTENNALKQRLQEQEETIKQQNDLIQKITEENKKLKNKKPSPTHEELVEDKLFHGKRRKFRK